MNPVPLPPLCLSDPPTRYWIATDLDNFLTSHNLRFTGALTSSTAPMAAASEENLAKYLAGDFEYLPYVRNGELSDLGIAPYSLTASRDYTVEVLLETVRKKLDPRLPSRLSAVFAFDNRPIALKVAERSGRLLNAVYEFELVESPLTRVVRANFEVITFLRRVIHTASWGVSRLEQFAEHYWTGGGELSAEVPDPWKPGEFREVSTERVTWEYLIEGRLDRVGGPLGVGKLL